MMTEPRVRLNVLAVDDEDDMCWALRQIIEGEGHRCLLAKTAREALQAVRRETLHLAFVDVKLPDLDGFDLVREMRVLVPQLPCVLVSGFLYSDDILVQDGLASGLIAGFIGKPFLLSQMQQVLGDFARLSPAQAATSHDGPGGLKLPPGGISSPPAGTAGTDCGRPSAPPETPKGRGPQHLRQAEQNS